MKHELKCWNPYYRDIVTGLKKFEVRRNDRNYKVGDMLKLKEYDPEDQKFTGAYTLRHVTYMVQGQQFGIKQDFCVLGIK